MKGSPPILFHFNSERNIIMEENRNNTVVTNAPEAPKPVAPQGQYIPAPQPPAYPNPYNLPPRNAVPAQPPRPEKLMSGLAFNITSMAIGIITFLIGITSLTDAIEYIFDNEEWYSFGSELSTSVGCLIFGLLCLAFAVLGIRKKENAGRSMGAGGLICGGLGIVCAALSAILLLSFF